MARLQRQNALVDALHQLGFQLGRNLPVPRLPGLPEPAASWTMDAYKQLGGVLRTPVLKPLGWDITTTGGLIVELDEEQHFNRYRAATLNTSWAVHLPWREDYLAYCSELEHIALKGHSGGGFWSSEGSVDQFGPAGPRRSLEGAGSPRWKQRAIYDALRDAAAAAGSVTLARVSVHDRVGAARLGDALRGHARLDLRALHALITSRTSNRDHLARGTRPQRDDVRSNSPARLATSPDERPASQGDAATFEPTKSARTLTNDDFVTVKDLMRELGYDDDGRVVRAALRRAFPSHPKNSRWDPLSPDKVSAVRRSVSPKR
ncbi:DUF7255 family protein [Microbacterium aurantiacum]|uniref:DUF7255 family protein n=1 Tax=Microbacterium aurantiacum TaxID=162393 RepID=UPI001F393D94|nr:hypothetical protein [Microbacterium aurantiacum]